jgi:PIN domain
MFSLLIDTCVWLDLAKDYQQQTLLSALEELIGSGHASLILPRTVVDEFARNKTRVVTEAGRSLSGTLKRVKEVVEKFGDPKKKRAVLTELNEVDHRLPVLAGAAAESVGRIETLFANTLVVEISDEVKLRAAQRAVDKRAPFHRERNSMGDAILIEVYADQLQAQRQVRTRFAFVTHNTKDFSHPTGNTKLPHPDISAVFSRVRSLYFTSLGEALRRVHPGEFADLMIEHEWHEEPRKLVEILEAIDEFCTKIWYDRHQLTRRRIEEGIIEIVEKEAFLIKDHKRRPIQRDIWAGARKAAAQVEKRFGKGSLGPWSEFEWGMLNGKLSALRWVLGEEWDMLDT